MSVVVTCRILGFATQAYYKWLKNPVSARKIEEHKLTTTLRELHKDDPDGGYRVLADELEDLDYQVSGRRIWWLYNKAGSRSVISQRRRKHAMAWPLVQDDLVQRNFSAEQPN